MAETTEMITVDETQEEFNKLYELSEDDDKKIAFLAMYIRKIVFAMDEEDNYQMEQNERRA